MSRANPEIEPDREIKLRTVVDRASANIAGQFEQQPFVESAIRQTLSDTYCGLGEYEEAEQQITRALELRRQVLGEEHPSTLGSMNRLALLHQKQGRYGEAEKLHEKTLEIERRLLGEEHPSTLVSMENLAVLYQKQGRPEDAEGLWSTLVEMSRRRDNLDPSATWLTQLASCLLEQAKYREAEPILRESLAIRAKRLSDDWRHSNAMSLLGASPEVLLARTLPSATSQAPITQPMVDTLPKAALFGQRMCL